MFRLCLVVLLAVALVQAKPPKPGKGEKYAEKVRSDLQQINKIARRVSNVPNDWMIKASCVNEFEFVPLSKDTEEASQKCLADMKTVSDLLVDMQDERTEFVEALNAATQDPHNVYDLMQLTAVADKYLKKLHKLAKKNDVPKEDRENYVNDCVLPVTAEIKKNAMTAEEKVKDCYGQE